MKYAIALAMLALVGCAQLQPQADPLIVRVEQTQQVAFDTFDTFLKLDSNNRALFKSNFADAHAVAEWLREPVVRPNGSKLQRGLAILAELKEAKLAYKAIPNSANKTVLVLQLSKVESAVQTAQEQLAVVKGN